jgi:sec-independent protein translocase protein TatB
MFDIGIGEVLALAVIGLLIFGPERLPKAAADAGRWLRQIREMATNARRELSDSAGVDFNGAMDSVREFRDLHPKRLASGLFEDDAAGPQGTNGSQANGGSAEATRPESTDGSVNKTPRPTFDPDLS